MHLRLYIGVIILAILIINCNLKKQNRKHIRNGYLISNLKYKKDRLKVLYQEFDSNDSLIYEERYSDISGEKYLTLNRTFNNSQLKVEKFHFLKPEHIVEKKYFYLDYITYIVSNLDTSYLYFDKLHRLKKEILKEDNKIINRDYSYDKLNKLPDIVTKIGDSIISIRSSRCINDTCYIRYSDADSSKFNIEIMIFKNNRITEVYSKYSFDEPLDMSSTFKYSNFYKKLQYIYNQERLDTIKEYQNGNLRSLLVYQYN